MNELNQLCQERENKDSKIVSSLNCRKQGTEITMCSQTIAGHYLLVLHIQSFQDFRFSLTYHDYRACDLKKRQNIMSQCHLNKMYPIHNLYPRTWQTSPLQDKGDLLEQQAADFIITKYITCPNIADSALNPLSSLTLLFPQCRGF